MPDEVIEIRFVGEEIAPGVVRSRDLAEVIFSTEEMIAELVSKDNPDIKKEDVVVGLVSLEKGSLTLGFTTPTIAQVFHAFSEISRAIEKKDFRLLPKSSIKSLKEIHNFGKKYKSDVKMTARDNGEEIFTILTSDTVIDHISMISGSTSIYGQVVRVGGREPKVMISLPTGDTIYARLGIADEYRLAKMLGERLYRWVGLTGHAKWDASDLELEEFRVEKVLPYSDEPIADAFKSLSSQFGTFFNDINNVEGYVSSVRGNNGGE